MEAAILTDLTKCIGCGACTLACQEINELPTQHKPDKLTDKTWTAVRQEKGINIRQQCMHCHEPTCASVCPVGALRKTPEGPVIYDEWRCIGCRYCMMACPFEIPTYEWDNPLPKVQKCIMCYDKRVKDGKEPACTSVCPTGATTFGDRDTLLEEARDRISHNPGRYVNHIYGETEAGGTGVLYLSPAPFEELGFKQVQQGVSYPHLTWDILRKIPNIVAVGGVMLVGIHWIIKRRMTMERLTNDGGSREVTQLDEKGGE